MNLKILGENCSNCRHHSCHEVPRNVAVYKPDDPLFADLFPEDIETSDEMDIVYECKHESHIKEIGKAPIYCSEWERSSNRSTSDIDAMIERWNQRNEKK